MDNIDDLMAKNAELLNSFNTALYSLDKDQLKQMSPYLADLNKLTEMLNSGNHDENVINEIKSKYGSESHK